MSDSTFIADSKKALLLAWIITSFLILVIIIAINLIPDRHLLQIAPACTLKTKMGTECNFCGMTRAFIEIGNWNLPKAISLNKGSIFLFGAFVMNELIFIIILSLKTIKTKGKKNENR